MTNKEREARELEARGLGKIRKALSDRELAIAKHTARIKAIDTDLAMGADMIMQGEDTLAEVK